MLSSALRTSRGRAPTYLWRPYCEQLEDRLVLGARRSVNHLRRYGSYREIAVVRRRLCYAIWTSPHFNSWRH